MPGVALCEKFVAVFSRFVVIRSEINLRHMELSDSDVGSLGVID